MLKLETELARIQWSPEQLRDMSQQYNLRTVTELASMMGIYPVVSSLQSLGLPTDIKINAAHLSYLESLKQFLPSQSLESWKSYLRARLILNYGPMLTKAFHEKQLEYQKALGILKADLPEWRQALQFADACSSLLIGKIYVENFFTEATKNEATKVISEIRASAAKLIGDSKRLSKPTKEKALQKLAKMEFAVGYPEVWPKFEELQTNPEDLVSNYRNAATFELKRNFDSLNKPVDKREWSRSPHEVNAGYIPTENRFVVNAAILHAPFFDEKASEAARYGGLGFVVGHEIGHAFDDMGSHFDSEGNLANWWTEEDRASYDKVKEKIIAQANAFEILPGVHLNGALQVGEIMGDMTGARVAMNVLARFIKEQKLDGKTTQRDFFRQLATVWREKIRPEVQKLYIATDPHPPGKFRTDGVVKNMPEFHSAFGTKLGDPMYQIPGKRIQIW